MPAMLTVVTVFAFVAIAIHVYIWILESFLWTKPKGREGSRRWVSPSCLLVWGRWL